MPQRAQVPEAPLRPTQNFVATLSWVRARPVLLLLEVAWRWLFGVPALLVLWHFGEKVLGAVPWRQTGIAQVSVNQLLTDPMRASATISQAILLVGPPLWEVLRWLLPALILFWAMVCAVGRTFVLQRMEASLQKKTGALFLLNLLRIPFLLGTAVLWWEGLSAVAQRTILQPVSTGGEPLMMVYVGSAIALTLGLFLALLALGWIFAIAPLLAMRNGLGVFGSLRAAVSLKPVRAGMIEINMVMGIVKIALLVLLMTFSATPLPFQSVITEEFLYWWTAGIAVLYFIASDFFHVARIAGYLHLWQQEAGVAK